MGKFDILDMPWRFSTSPVTLVDTSHDQPLRHHFPVHDGDVDEKQDDHKKVIHETQDSKESFRN